MNTSSLRREFVSYPKSGRSWLRFILGQLDLLKFIRFHHDQFEFNNPARPPHDFSVTKRLALYTQVEKLVYLERDPRDVMVSLFFQVTGRFRDFFDYRGTLAQFIRDDYFGAHNLQQFRALWAEITAQRPFLIVSYEACHANPNALMRRVLNYYELEVSPGDLQEAVAQSSFDRMKNLESSGQFPEPWLRLRNNSPKIRQGRIGGYREYLDAESVAYLNDVFGCD